MIGKRNKRKRIGRKYSREEVRAAIKAYPIYDSYQARELGSVTPLERRGLNILRDAVLVQSPAFVPGDAADLYFRGLLARTCDSEIVSKPIPTIKAVMRIIGGRFYQYFGLLRKTL